MSRSSLLRDRGVRALLTAEGINSFGTQMTYIVLPWFVLTTTGSPAKTSLVLAAELTPVALFGLFSSTVISRVGARRTLMISDVARAILLATIPTLQLAGRLTFPLLVALVFCVGVFMVPHVTAQRVIIPELVGEDEARMGETMSLLQVGSSISMIAGPAAGGLLIGVLGETNVLYIDAATYVASFLLLLLFVAPRYPAEAPENGAIRAGLRLLLSDRLLRLWTLSVSGINVVWGALGVALPVLVLQRYGDRPEVLGWIFGGYGVGSVLGGLAAFRVFATIDRMLIAAVAGAAYALSMWALVPELPWPAVAASAAAAGTTLPMVFSIVITTRTTRSPKHLRPSVHAAAVTLAIMTAPVGALAAGPLLERWSLEAVLAATIGLNCVCGLLFAAAALRERGSPGEVPGLVVDREHEAPGAGVAAGVARRRD